MDPVIVPRSEHSVSRKSIDPDAVKVLYRLHRAGHHGYLVGGGVRDLLLDREPKDFDISTDANPQEVKRLFRNCRLIGRRFRLAHVHFGEKIVEVSTFRRRTEPEEGDGEDLLIRSDNTFGTAEEDALRRDFTINGLFYDIGTFSVIDYVGGLKDLNERTIRTIGDPDTRFREDPVRMIRAIKFAARLDFIIEPETWDAILRQSDEIRKSARPRVLEELFRLLTGGYAEESFRLLARSRLLSILLPELVEALGLDEENPSIEDHRTWLWLRELDRRRKNEDFPGANALAVLLAEVSFGDQDGEGEQSELWLSPEAEDRLRNIFTGLSLPRRDAEKIFQIYRAQRRLVGQRGRRFSPRTFVRKHYFDDVFRFFSLSVSVTGRHGEALARWEKLAEGVPMSERPSLPARRRRRRRRRDSDMESVDRAESFAGSAPVSGHNSATEKPSPSTPPEDDEDSQIRFLGWSDEPELLRPPARQAVPIPNPYHRDSRRSGAPRPARSNGGSSNGRRFDRSGSGGAPHGQGGARRDGRRGGRRKPRSRQD